MTVSGDTQHTRHRHLFFHSQSASPQTQTHHIRLHCLQCPPQKDEIYHTRLTVGGNLIDFPGNKSTPTADLLTAKLLINSTISTPGAVFLGINLANFYLNTPMPKPEYMHLPLDIIPEEIIAKYNLRDLVDKEGWVYIKIRKGRYGLPQAGILANQLFKKRLSTKGYYQCQTLRVSGTTSGVALCSALSSTILE